MSGPDHRFYFWFACSNNCSFWLATETRTPPAGWEALQCRYCATPLRALVPQGAPE